jgi:hypothetical protein
MAWAVTSEQLCPQYLTLEVIRLFLSHEGQLLSNFYILTSVLRRKGQEIPRWQLEGRSRKRAS